MDDKTYKALTTDENIAFSFPKAPNGCVIHIYKLKQKYTFCCQYHKNSLGNNIQLTEKNKDYLCKTCLKHFSRLVCKK